MKSDRIDLGLTGYDELFMSTEERLDAKKPKVEAIPLAALTPFQKPPLQGEKRRGDGGADEKHCRRRRPVARPGAV